MHPSHAGIRNAAWFVRNARLAGQDSNKMLGWLCFEVKRVLAHGEPLENIVASLVDLFKSDGQG